MANEKSKVTFCPNCQQPAVRAGNEVTCEACDATFTIIKKEAKVKEVGRIEKIEQRLDQIESALPGTEPEPEPDPESEPDPEDEPEAADDEEDIL